MTSPIDISPEHMKTVCNILQKHLPPNVNVWVFGSRSDWTTKNSSDLDLALEGGDKLDYEIMDTLEYAFEESDLPYKVDVIDLKTVNTKFKKNVDTQKIQLPMLNVNNNWTEIKLGDFAPFVYGKSLPTSQRNTSGNIPVVGSGGIIGHHNIGLTNDPTIVIGRKGTVGSIYYFPGPCWPIDTTFYVTGNDTSLLKFKYYSLQTLGLEQMNSDSAVPGLNRDAAHAKSLFVPSKQEQKNISHILGVLDAKIDLNLRINHTLEKMARALFKSWFVDFEPVRAKIEGRWGPSESLPGLPAHLYNLFPSSWIDSELGKIPERWAVGHLHHYATLNPESWNRANIPKEIKYIDLSNVKSGVIQGSTHYLWKNAPSRAQRILRSGDTIVGTVRPGNKSYALIGNDGLTGSTGFAVLRPLQSEYREFVYLTSTDSNNIKYLTHRADGADYPAVRPEVVANIKVIAPRVDKDVNILYQFSRIVSPIMNKMLFFNLENCILSTHRDTLLPKLMSGEIQLFQRVYEKVTV